MLDPKIANLVSAELQSDCVVVFDECHNIDNACIEAMSLTLNRKSLELASSSLKRLEDLITKEKQSNSDRLKVEYASLVKSMAHTDIIKSESEMLHHPILSTSVIKEAIPGNIRKAEHFLPVLRKLIVYFKKLIADREIKILSPLQIVYDLQEKHFIE